MHPPSRTAPTAVVAVVLSALPAMAAAGFLAALLPDPAQAQTSGRMVPPLLPGDWAWDLDGSGNVSAGDLVLSGGGAGGFTGWLAAGVVRALPTAFLDADGDGGWDGDEPLLLDADGGLVLSVGDVWWDQRFGVRVAAADLGLGTPLRSVSLAFAWADLDGDGAAAAGEPLFVDADRSGTVGVGDLRLSGQGAGGLVGANDTQQGVALAPPPGGPLIVPLPHDLAVASLRGARLEDGARAVAVAVANAGPEPSPETSLVLTLDGVQATGVLPALGVGQRHEVLFPWGGSAAAAFAVARVAPVLPDLDPLDDAFSAFVREVPAPAPPTTVTVAPPTVTVAPPTVTVGPSGGAGPTATLPFAGGLLLGVAGAVAGTAALPTAVEAGRRLLRQDPPERPPGPCEPGRVRVKPVPPKGKARPRDFVAIDLQVDGQPGAHWGAKSDVVASCRGFLRRRRAGDGPDRTEVLEVARSLWDRAASEADGQPLRILARVRGGRVKAGVALLRCTPDGAGWKWKRLRQWTPSLRDEADLVLLDVPEADPDDPRGVDLLEAGLWQALEDARRPVGPPRFDP